MRTTQPFLQSYALWTTAARHEIEYFLYFINQHHSRSKKFCHHTEYIRALAV